MYHFNGQNLNDEYNYHRSSEISFISLPSSIFSYLKDEEGLTMPISQPRLAWFKLKCPYPHNSPDYKKAYAKLQNASYADLETLRAEFDEYDDGSIPVIHYQHKGEWYAKVGLTGSPQKLNMRGIQQHGRKWRVQKRTRGHLRKWTYDSLPEAQRKRDKLFG